MCLCLDIKDGFLSISILMYRNGYLNAKINEVIDYIGEINELIETFLMQFYETHDIAKEIYISEDISINILKETLNINIVNPKASSGQELILMAIENAKNKIPVYSITFGTAKKEQLQKIADLTSGKVFDGKTNLLEAFKLVRGYN